MTLVLEIPNPCFVSVTGGLFNKTPLFSKWSSIIGARTPIVLGEVMFLKHTQDRPLEGEKRWKWE